MGAYRAVNNEFQRDIAIGEVRDMPVPFIIKVTKPVSRKTTKQIRYAHSMVNALAGYKQCKPEDAKTDAKREFGIITVCTSIVTGERGAKLKSFADYSKEEMLVFIAQMEAFLDEEEIPFIRAKDDDE